SEKKLREVTLESEHNRVQMRGLQQQFSRMEETVRNLLQSQGSSESNGEEPVTIIKTYQETLTQEGKRCKTGVEDICMSVDKDSSKENSSTEEEKAKMKLLLERLKALEAENSALAMENENQREQYERCLDEVANQVVQALLTQKDLREECLKLKTRVFDLEQQNRTLSVLFQQRMRPTSGLLLQKLHSRILDLSSGDFLLEIENNRSLIQSQSADVQVHECQQNMKSGVPALKFQSQIYVAGPHRVYPRSSCSSSELSLSSACSEYSSGSSYTWNDGKACSKRSSVNWDKRISIGSSLPSNLSSPADDLPPTRIKENHILEGLKKLQKQKILLEPPSLITKWGYKDCMDSNEGIYSPGIKCSSHKEQAYCTPEEIGAICIEHQKTSLYDSDSHEDADDESSSLTLLYEIPGKDCRHYCNKLTHSVSDSLFSWEPDRSHLPERGSYFNSQERPEKLTSFVNEFQSEVKSSTNVKQPVLRLDKSLTNLSWRDLNLHLSDTDDNEILDELHIESSDEKSPSEMSLTPFVDKHEENPNVHLKKENCQCGCSKKQSNQVPVHSHIRLKACNLVKQQKVIKKTSSEECITVIYDAEDGKPIEFSSHQTGIVTLTRDEISINHPYIRSNAEYTECLTQGKTMLQKATNAKNFSILQTCDNGTEKKTVKTNLECEHGPAICSTECPVYLEKPKFQNTSPQKSGYSNSSKASSPSCVQASNNLKLSKIPSRGKFSPQKSKVSLCEDTIGSKPHCPRMAEKTLLSPVKCPRFRKVQSPTRNSDSKVDSHIPKVFAYSSQNSRILDRTDWPKNQPPQPASVPQRLLEPIDCGEPPTRDVHFDLPAPEASSPPPPPPPGRSTSLLIRPNYEHSPTVPLKEAPVSFFHNVTSHQTQTSNLPATSDVESNHFHEKEDIFTQNKCISKLSPGTCQGLPKFSQRKVLQKPQTSQYPVIAKNFANLRLFSQHVSPQKQTFSSSPDCHKIIGEAFMTQMSPSPVSLLSQGSDAGKIPDTDLRPHLPVGLKLLLKSPQLLRKSSTIPGKQEKESMNAASKCCVNSTKQSQGESLFQTTLCVADIELRSTEKEIKDIFPTEIGMGPPSPETCSFMEQDGLENKLVKRSVSSNCKTYLKPALGMNGAKARSHSFSIHMGEKSPMPSTEGLGKFRTQIITNTSERGNSLTRQNSNMEGLQLKIIPGTALTSDMVASTTKTPESSYSRQVSEESTSDSTSQVSSPCKLPSHMSPKGDYFNTEMALESSTSISSEQILPLQKNLDSVQCPRKHEGSKVVLQEGCLKASEIPNRVSASSVLQPTIEEKVMLCIQENMQKGQGQNKLLTTETKQKTGGPSIASWFGFRKSKLPALSGRKNDTSKTKIEKKEGKGLTFGNKQTKSEKRKDKKKSEQHCEAENELNKRTLNCGILDNVPKGKKVAKATNNSFSPTRCEQKNNSATTFSGKDSFMKELLHRVDKKAAQQTETGSNNVSYRSMLKGSSQGSSLPSDSIGPQGNQKKNSKTKADMEVAPSEALVKVVTENFPEDEDDTITDSTCQNHLIESCCQMRTLDSGIGTFPLPDSGNRSTGRHVSKQELDLETHNFPSPGHAFPHTAYEKAKTLEREVPSTTDKNEGSVESIISHSASDPTMTAKSLQPFQSRLPKPASAGKNNIMLHIRFLLTCYLFPLRELICALPGLDSNMATFRSATQPSSHKALIHCTIGGSKSQKTSMNITCSTLLQCIFTHPSPLYHFASSRTGCLMVHPPSSPHQTGEQNRVHCLVALSPNRWGKDPKTLYLVMLPQHFEHQWGGAC
uniref:NCK associated protein 5 n=1 Tax=Anolis carolinensis TaxID=28377 RepID=H9G3T7_ANOCA